jgi:hypothetical protein
MRSYFGFGALLGLLVLGGCGDGGFKDDGVPQAFKTQAADASTIAKSVDGNYDKLTAEQKTTFLTMANGNEQAARRLLMMMAHPPNEGMKASHGPPGAGAPGH